MPPGVRMMPGRDGDGGLMQRLMATGMPQLCGQEEAEEDEYEEHTAKKGKAKKEKKEKKEVKEEKGKRRTRRGGGDSAAPDTSYRY